MTDPWVELTPGALGRLTLHADPCQVADDVRQWAGLPTSGTKIADWFRRVADALEEQ